MNEHDRMVLVCPAAKQVDRDFYRALVVGATVCIGLVTSTMMGQMPVML